MDFGRRDVLRIPKCPLQNGCITRTYTLCSGGPVPTVGCSPTSGVPEVWQGRIAQGWGTHTSLCRQGIPLSQMRRGVCTPTAWDRVVCMFVSVREGNLDNCSCMLWLWMDCCYFLWLILILNVLFKTASSLHIIKESMHHSNPDLA